jgi:uncharacterized membrane protein YadS
MSEGVLARVDAAADRALRWTELWRKENWWAVWLGLGLTVAGWVLFAHGASLAWLAVVPPKWATLSDLRAHFAANAPRYVAQLGLWLVLFGVGGAFVGVRPRAFLPSFVPLYLLAVVILAAGAWAQAQYYNLEPPLLALAVGLLLANATDLPRRCAAALRVEFYIKTGIVLLGATLPFSLIVWAGPVAILQASVVSIVTFLVIFRVGRRLGLDQRLAAVLGAGGAVCGVSAAIAVAGAVRAKKEDPPIAITLVVLWAIGLMFVLPLIAGALHLPTGVGGRPQVGQIWWRFPKFVIGFLLASALVTLAVRQVSFADYNALVKPRLVAPITTLRIWSFTFSFLAIGLSTRLRDLTPAGRRPFLAFSAGAVVNIVIGFVLSVLVFGGYWATLSH